MAAFSDFMEDRVLEMTLGQSAYQIPSTIRVTSVDDTATYTVVVNGTSYDYPAVGGDTETEILSGLQVLISAGTDPLTATVFTDGNGTEGLFIVQDATYTSLLISVSATGTGVLSEAQEVYAALFTTPVEDDGSGTEVVNSGYTRRVMPFAIVASGQSSNSADVVFGPAGVGGFGTVSHIALFDAFTGGNLLMHNAADTAKVVAENDTYTLRSGMSTLQVL